MVEEQNHSQSPITPPEPGDSTSLDTGERTVNTVPATIEIDLGIDPVAYRYESWSEMADGWVDSFRSTAKTMPDPDHNPIRNVTPLVTGEGSLISKRGGVHSFRSR